MLLSLLQLNLSVPVVAPPADVPLLKPRIQRAIIAALGNGPYYLADYQVSAGQAKLLSVQEPGDQVAPTSVRCNEIGASFKRSTRYGRDRVLDRETWSFQALVQFSKEVISEAVENNLTSQPFGIPSLGDQPPVIIELDKVTYAHPTTSSRANSGSVLRFDFTARPLRR